MYIVLLKYGRENAEMQKLKFEDVTLRYSMSSGPIYNFLDTVIEIYLHVFFMQKKSWKQAELICYIYKILLILFQEGHITIFLIKIAHKQGY